MGTKLSELVEATAVAISDIFHLRTVGGIDKKITGDNLIKALPLFLVGADTVDAYLKAQGAATPPIFEKLALRDTGIGMNTFTRTTGGSHSVTGVGFEPSIVIFLAVDSTGANQNWSIGYDAQNAARAIYRGTNGTVVESILTASTYILRDGGNNIYASISSMDSDGFTISFTLTGTCSVRLIYLALP
jgi:hypothetical protein